MILALSTPGATTKLWLLQSAQTAKHAHPVLEWESGRELADQLLTRITSELAAADHKLEDLKGIVIFSGPGSFTSLRIGHMVANTLADGLSIPIVGATGEKWLEDGCQELAKAPIRRPVLPEYGAEANITKPKQP